jgi:hypothetical protein
MGDGHCEVVIDDGDISLDILDEPLTARSSRTVRQRHTDEKLRDGDRSHGNFVVVVDGVVQRSSVTFGID